MKKLLLMACILLAGMGSVYAQKQGDQAVGIQVPINLKSSLFGIGAKYQYNITDQIRLEGNAIYFFPKNSFSAAELAAHAHYLFPLNEKFTLYPLVGAGYYMTRTDLLGKALTAGTFAFNAGGGLSYNLTEKLSLGAEAKYLLVKGGGSTGLSLNLMFRL